MKDVYNAINQANEQSTTQKRYTKEEYSQMMKEKRQHLFTLANEQTMNAVSDSKLFLQYLNLQSKLDYTVTNTLLVMAQKPDATMLKDFTHWKELNHYIVKGSKGIEILEPGNEYTKKDGTIGISYNPKKVFDVSEIKGKIMPADKKEYEDSELVSAIIYRTEIHPEVVRPDSTLPQDVFFDENSSKVYVKHGLNPTDMINGLLREYCYAECFQLGINRQDAVFIAESAGYVLSKEYGVDGYDVSFANGCAEHFLDREVPEVKKELESIKEVRDQVSDRMQRGLYTLQQNKQEKQKDEKDVAR